MLIKKIYCDLVRFICPDCGKTFTDYPDFAIPHKHYTRPTITGFSDRYIESDNMTYQQAVMVDNSVPGYPVSDPTEAPTLAPTTIHRWITTLSGFTRTRQTALNLLLQENPVLTICRDLAQLTVGQRKYRSDQRKRQLIGCLELMIIKAFFKTTFKISIFTELAIRCGFN